MTKVNFFHRVTERQTGQKQDAPEFHSGDIKLIHAVHTVV